MSATPLQRDRAVSVHRAVYHICSMRRGQIIIDKEECEMDADDLMMQAHSMQVLRILPMRMTATKSQLHLLILMQSGAALEEAGITMASAEVTMIPQTYVTLTDEADITNIGRILDLLDDDDDVQEVYHNWEE